MRFPPVFEQNQIVQTIENLECKYDEIINKAGDQIRLLQERRTALISAAVTGKIEHSRLARPGGFNCIFCPEGSKFRLRG